MNNAQVKYARERATSIYKNREASLKEKFTTPAVEYTNEEKLELIRKGLFVTKEEVAGYGMYLSSFIVFPEERSATLDNEGFKAAQKQLKAEYDVVMDEILLGDEQEALQLLRAFTAHEG